MLSGGVCWLTGVSVRTMSWTSGTRCRYRRSLSCAVRRSLVESMCLFFLLVLLNLCEHALRWGAEGGTTLAALFRRLRAPTAR